MLCKILLLLQFEFNFQAANMVMLNGSAHMNHFRFSAISLPSWVAPACNPSGGIKGDGTWLRICQVGLEAATCWPAHSKLRVDQWILGEGLRFIGSRQEGTASGWLHRAANTSPS
ncbi:unnamed protein product [Trifolium pratense]|uniref:Uncharacterized protein n=1 Tax=Trifolium pratense TaxID=57577 RepID=A0ACB0ID09_TRIPR|nr:unnamed protein product [Trifolium pratense]